MPELFGPAWVHAFKAEIDASSDYKVASNHWEWPVVLVQRADPKAGNHAPSYVFLNLWHGTCREARVGSALDADHVPIVISADRATWLELLNGKVEPLTAVMLRRISIDKGSATQLMGSVAGIRALVKAAEAASEGYT